MTAIVSVGSLIVNINAQEPSIVKTVDIVLPALIIGAAAKEPFVAKTCVLAPPTPPAEPEDDIFVPTPPDTGIEDLPELDTETQIIDTSPEQIIGCVNKLVAGQEQQILEAFFSSRVEDDGVVNRDNNDIWVYRGGAWQNVGPTPGPQVVVVTVVPPTNLKISLQGKTRTVVGVTLFNYALGLITNLAIRTRTTLSVASDKYITPPYCSVSVFGQTPSKIGEATREVINIIQTAGTASPLLGGNQADPVVAGGEGWTLSYDSSDDELSIETTEFGFDFTLDEVNYSKCFVNSNSYITFGIASTVFGSFGASNPSIPKILIAPGDFSVQRLYRRKGNGVYRIRVEGNTLYSAPAGNSNRFWEISFFRHTQDGTQYIELITGTLAGPANFVMIATASTQLAVDPPQANQSWVFTGNSTGTEWTIANEQYIDYSVSIDLQVPSVGIGVEVLTPNIEAGLIIKPPATGLTIDVHNPLVSTDSGIAIPVAILQVSRLNPFSVGYKVVLQAPVQVFEVQGLAPLISTGKAITLEAENINTSASGLSVSTGVSINIDSATEVLASVNQVLISRPAYLDVQSTTVLMEAVAPGISAGTSVSIPNATLNLIALAVSARTGASIIPETTSNYTSAIPPTVLIEGG